MKKFSLVICFVVALLNPLCANEGMWQLTMLEKLGLSDSGCKIPDSLIYNTSHSCIKDAIVGLGSEANPFRFFCSGAIVSSKGLVFTNHHCAYSCIQQHSSIDNNLLKDGFWATTLSEELPNEGLTASVVVDITDVSNQILSQLCDSLDEEARNLKIDSLCTAIVDEVEDSSVCRANVSQFFNQNQFLLIRYIIYKDVRLVGAPPEAIGKFGGDTDNWQWRRHTGDFAVLRIYTDTLGLPAKYSPTNIPLVPRYYLPISLSGYSEDDFSMILGFPGSTQRYLLASQIENLTEIKNRETYNIRSLKLDVMQKFFDADSAVRLKYASKWSSIANYWKYAHEQNRSIDSLNIFDKKIGAEAKFIERDSSVAKYFKRVEVIESQLSAYEKSKIYYREVFSSGIEILSLAKSFSHLESLLKNRNNKKALYSEIEKLRSKASDFFRNYCQPLDKELTDSLLVHFFANVDAEHRTAFLDDFKHYFHNGIFDADRFTDNLFNSSIFGSQHRLEAFLHNPQLSKLQKDLAYRFMQTAREQHNRNYKKYKNLISERNKNVRLLMSERLKLSGDNPIYPDANSTLRFTYGHVKSYRIGNEYFANQTTFPEMIAKFDSTKFEFTLPNSLLDLYQNTNPQPYADSNRLLPICFISTNDITGGNSGSCVLNARGELIGIAFDGNKEAMCGDIRFENDIQRCINVDIRFVLYVIDKFAHANRIIDELSIHR